MQRLAFDPAGGLWLASEARLVHAPVDALGGSRCDDSAPSARIGLAGRALRDRVSLAALRRSGGLRVSVREPAVISVGALLQTGGEIVGSVDPKERVIRSARGGAARVRFSGRLRDIAEAVAAGRRATISIVFGATDSEGNSDLDVIRLRVTA